MTHYSDVTTLAWPGERDACGVGFIADIHGRKTHATLQYALSALIHLTHRGAVSADGRTGDGAGVLTQLPHKLFRKTLLERGCQLEHDEDLAVGVFFVENTAPADEVFALVEEEIAASGLSLLTWREPPLREETLGEHAYQRRPVLRHLLLGKPAGLDPAGYERLLFLTRKRIERRLDDARLGRYYIPSLSSRTIVYKGLMVADQLSSYYRDLDDPDFVTAIAVFHQRYSTNTMPRWSLAQPFRFLAHNGEINTLQGNVNFMRAREPLLKSDLWGEDISELLPIIEAGGSDSAALDNAFELLTLSGRDPLHALMMLLPQAFEGDVEMDPELRGFFEYHAALMEPWDGPAAVALSDGRYAVAGLDRNGLRPQRYWISRDGLVIVGSEAGMVPLPEDDVVERGRLGPGTMLAVDTEQKRLLKNDDIKSFYARRRPYRRWVETHLRRPDEELAGFDTSPSWSPPQLVQRQKVFGYSREDYNRIFEPMVFDAAIPVGSMGDDTPLALLSEQPQQLYRYFKQRFAQVTNPPIDPLRERLVMSLETFLGPRGDLLREDEASAGLIKFDSPIIDEAAFQWLRSQQVFQSACFTVRFRVDEGPEGLEPAVEELCRAVEEAVIAGAGIIVLSDRDIGPRWAPIPMLLAAAAVHHRLLRVGRRTRTAIVVETGEPREDHHFACLIGYGVALVYPYLALATAEDVPRRSRRRENELSSSWEAKRNYLQAVEKGLLKIMSKMGISTISSYRGAQIFEAIGIDRSVIQRYFTGTPSRIGGVGLSAFATDVLRFHAEAFGEDPTLRDRGLYRFRKLGEYHALNPLVFKALHKAVRTGSFEVFQEYARQVDERPPCNLRDLVDYRRAGTPLPLEAVEPIDAIVKRFTTQAMSHGAISREAHETLAVAMNRLGAMSNSGEGGEDSVRFTPYQENRPDLSHGDWHPRAGDWGNSAIKQVASGRFGVTPHYLVSARELEIKMAQGSKPGEGGQIPGHKVNAEIAAIRRSVPGVTLISPPPHHDIYSIEDLAQLIYDLKRVNREARIGVKLVATSGVGTIAAGVVKGYADNIQISGHDGGTGASPLSSVKHAGVPWELGLAETQQLLVENDLRGRVTLRVDGGLKTGRDVVIAALLGAEAFGFGTAALVAAGCAMVRQCHLNTCPVGVATQKPELRRKYAGTPEHVVNFITYLAQQVRMILAEMGVTSLEDIIGRSDLLVPKEKLSLPRAATVDLSALLRNADPSGRKARRAMEPRNNRPEAEEPLDEVLWRTALPAIHEGRQVRAEFDIGNRERSLAARLSGEIARHHGEAGLPAGTIEFTFRGSAGQSFGLFNNRGVTLRLEGEAQDYVGKGMFGGEIIIAPPSGLEPHRNVIVGNTVLYGATGGSLYAAGQAGERLCVRNSGGRAVVEGCGDHGCEYMTGGVAVILGRTGRNFAAGMSGGVAYVYDDDATFARRYNPGMVGIERIKGGVDEELLHAMLVSHRRLTGSVRAAEILGDWSRALTLFWRVAPNPITEETAATVQDTQALEQAALQALQEESGWRWGSLAK